MALPLVRPAAVDFSGIGNLPAQYMQAQSQAEQLRALAEGRQLQQEQRAALGAFDPSGNLTEQVTNLARVGAVQPGQALNIIQQQRAQDQNEARRANIQRGLFGDGQRPGILARSGLTEQDIQAFALMDPEDALKAYQEARQGTDDIQEYNFARQQGYGGTFRDFMLEGRKAGATSISIGAGQDGPQFGKIPQGEMLNVVRDQQGNVIGYRMDPVPGSPADREIQSAEAAGGRRDNAKAVEQSVMLDTIGNIRQKVRASGQPLFGAVGGQILAGVGGTDAFDLAQLIEPLRSQISLGALQDMRNNSPTGAGLGSVQVRELELLMAKYGSLNQAQTEEQFMSTLEQVERGILDIAHGKGNWWRRGNGTIGYRGLDEESDKPLTDDERAELESLRRWRSGAQ